MTQVTEEMTLANQICGCATPEQRRADIAALLAYREQAVQEAVAALSEANARIAELEQQLKDCRTMLLATGASLAEAIHKEAK